MLQAFPFPSWQFLTLLFSLLFMLGPLCHLQKPSSHTQPLLLLQALVQATGGLQIYFLIESISGLVFCNHKPASWQKRELEFDRKKNISLKSLGFVSPCYNSHRQYTSQASKNSSGPPWDKKSVHPCFHTAVTSPRQPHANSSNAQEPCRPAGRKQQVSSTSTSSPLTRHDLI